MSEEGSSAADRWLTFDCFGTLVSWQRGFPQILKSVVGDRSEELAQAYHRFEWHVEAAPYRSYKTVLRTTLRLAAQHLRVPLGEDYYDVLAEHWDELPVFEDVGPALRAVRDAGWKVAALTNCDRDLLERTKATLPFAFDTAITAEDVRSYKPSHEHFLRFEQMGVSRDRWIHVACSYFHDVVPARDLGIPCIWIDRDRTGEDPSAATLVQPDLQGLATSAARILSR